jgi:hypothetical protein
MQGISGDRLELVFLKDSLGNGNINDDYSSTEGVFTYEPDEEIDLDVIGIRMATTQNLKTRDGFGDGAELENSFIIRVEDKDNNIVLDLSAGVPITTNNDLTLYASNDVIKENQDLVKIGEFKKRFGNPIKVRGNIGEKIVARINDNMSNRVERLYVILSGSKD